ncbi:amidohydrolase family protein [Paenalcaligenes niemegkensis]|uniref:amidohydrolase family protein n=1 Tax=Paenalcaligenes niemegkensis TaxID=2895469 RepID=UPI001EE94400|nr:amidohydrolase family protein [Paenalcaligenes niemegkensis]MCQ9618173.1 amidohydrolase family protein [Paenalcaligenes niemegkensis]
MKIDAHQHFWTFNPTDFPWIDSDMEMLRRDYHAEQAVSLLDRHGFDAAIAVQARADWVENDWLFALAGQSSRIAGVVGWADLLDESAQEKMDVLLGHPQCLGVRAMLQDMSFPASVMQDAVFNRYLKQIQDQGVVYEVLLRHDQLDGVISFCRHNDSHFLVVDHLAKPDYEAGITSASGQRWSSVFQQLSELPHVYVKLSGLLTEVDVSALKSAADADLVFWPFLDAVLEWFGAQRVVFGSDWPVAHLRGEYDMGLGVIERWAQARLSASEVELLFGTNARRLYSI